MGCNAHGEWLRRSSCNDSSSIRTRTLRLLISLIKISPSKSEGDFFVAFVTQCSGLPSVLCPLAALIAHSGRGRTATEHTPNGAHEPSEARRVRNTARGTQHTSPRRATNKNAPQPQGQRGRLRERGARCAHEPSEARRGKG